MRLPIWVLSLLLVINFSCNNNENKNKETNNKTSDNNVKHFITDKDYRKAVKSDFAKVKKLAAGRKDALFAVFCFCCSRHFQLG